MLSGFGDDGAAALVAHQGGWDEILFVLGPILLIGGLLRLARQRAMRGHGSSATGTDDEAHNGESPESR